MNGLMESALDAAIRPSDETAKGKLFRCRWICCLALPRICGAACDHHGTRATSRLSSARHQTRSASLVKKMADLERAAVACRGMHQGQWGQLVLPPFSSREQANLKARTFQGSRSAAPRSKTGRWEPPPQNLRYPEFSKGETERKRNEQMSAKSKAQQMAAGAALAAKRGEKKKSELKGASKSMEKSMSEKELDKMASTKRKGKPQKKS